MDARESNSRCRAWRKQDCTNCQHLGKDSASYYYKTTQKLWHAGRGNPLTGENCEGCDLKEFSLTKQLVERIKMDASDVFETVGCLDVEAVAKKRDIVAMLESIAESLGSCTSRADVIGLRIKEIGREAPIYSASDDSPMENFIVVQKEGTAVNSGYI